MVQGRSFFSAFRWYNCSGEGRRGTINRFFKFSRFGSSSEPLSFSSATFLCPMLQKSLHDVILNLLHSLLFIISLFLLFSLFLLLSQFTRENFPSHSFKPITICETFCKKISVQQYVLKYKRSSLNSICQHFSIKFHHGCNDKLSTVEKETQRKLILPKPQRIICAVVTQ